MPGFVSNSSIFPLHSFRFKKRLFVMIREIAFVYNIRKVIALVERHKRRQQELLVELH